MAKYGPVCGIFVHDDALEAHTHNSLVIRHLIELSQWGLGLGQPQQVLGRDDHQGLPELPVNLQETNS